MKAEEFIEKLKEITSPAILAERSREILDMYERLDGVEKERAGKMWESDGSIFFKKLQ